MKTKKSAKTRRNRTANTQFTADDRIKTVTGFRRSGMTLTEFAETWGISDNTLRKWNRAFEEGGQDALACFSSAGGRPKGSKKPVPPAVRKAVVAAKEKYPFFGVRRIRSWCARAFGIETPRRAVEETLQDAGFKTPSKRRKPRKAKSRRFERAKPMQMWQSDITQFVCPRTEKKVFLTVFLDDCTRYVVGWEVAANPTADLVMKAYESAINRYGRPEEILTDQGRQYASWRGKTDFQKKLKQDGVRHVLSRSHHPETLGKCERLWKTVKEELCSRVEIVSVENARERLTHWFGHYNFFRPHQALDGAVPADRFFGVEEAMRKVIQEAVTRNAEALALAERPRQPFYMAAQIGETALAVSAERGGLVVSTGEETRRLAFEDLGSAITRIAANEACLDMSEAKITPPERPEEVVFPESAPILADRTKLEQEAEHADIL